MRTIRYPGVSGGAVNIEHDISNTGPVDADASTTRFEVAVCDGVAQLPALDPEDPESERVCREGVEGFLDSFTEYESVPRIAPNTRITTNTDITSQLPVSPTGTGLWVSITAHVDDAHDVDESNEGDNTRFETTFIIPLTDCPRTPDRR